MDNPHATGGLLSELQRILPGLSPGLRRAADHILRDPEHAVTQAIGELAEEAGCSEATVVRLARDLGCTGYRQLRATLREELAFDAGQRTSLTGDAEAARRLGTDIDPSDSLHDTVNKVAWADGQAVRDTAAGLDLAQLERAVDVLDAARRVVTFGVGASAFAAMDLQQKLARIGRAATCVTDVHQGLPAIALLGEQDVAVVVSHTGETRDALDAAAVAAEHGATLVAVTNAPRSALARRAQERDGDALLLTRAQESPMRSGATASRIAQLSLMDILFVSVVQRRHAEAVEALERTYQALRGR